MTVREYLAKLDKLCEIQLQERVIVRQHGSVRIGGLNKHIMFIEVESREEIDCLVAVLSLGLCMALEGGQLTINEANNYLFSPYSRSVLQEIRAGAEAVHVVDLGTWLEDYESMLPERLPERLNDMKLHSLSILQSLPKSEEGKEKWLKIKAGAVQEGRIRNALLVLLEDLTKINTKHEELSEKSVIERMYDAIYHGYIVPQADYAVPNHFGLMRADGNRRVYKAISYFLNHPEVIASRDQLQTPEERLAAFQDPYAIWEGMGFDEYFGYRHEP